MQKQRKEVLTLTLCCLMLALYKRKRLCYSRRQWSAVSDTNTCPKLCFQTKPRHLASVVPPPPPAHAPCLRRYVLMSAWSMLGKWSMLGSASSSGPFQGLQLQSWRGYALGPDTPHSPRPQKTKAEQIGEQRRREMGRRGWWEGGRGGGPQGAHCDEAAQITRLHGQMGSVRGASTHRCTPCVGTVGAVGSCQHRARAQASRTWADGQHRAGGRRGEQESSPRSQRTVRINGNGNNHRVWTSDHPWGASQRLIFMNICQIRRFLILSSELGQAHDWDAFHWIVSVELCQHISAINWKYIVSISHPFSTKSIPPYN